ncbi:PREDICTED: uncharacterized protein LOC105457924 [Wasmannia auropunctata]|uniref:uncharacterized protein LOC105457924 n=1 Tax=Wasmannia auropunctata TaxID=64793 RepID=UPI0005EFDCF6|nr:PREDICTED: uncharacterized protein LOC105457924 [Wasmannia auropunctata]
MADRIKILIQKRISLKAQVTYLTNLLDKGRIDESNLKLRIARLTELFHAFEDFNDELEVLDPNDAHWVEFTNIQERFYSLASDIETRLNAANAADASERMSNTSNNETRSDNEGIVTATKRRRIKLPEAPLPTFDGKFENWLAFKNAFNSMIGSQADLSEIDKLHYLKSALTGEAGNKIKIFSIDGVDYKKAWELLERSYEVKRVLISKHLSALVNLPTLDKESTIGLTKLADDAQQHVASLLTLGVTVGQEMVVHLLESKLPRSTLDKWEITLDRDTFPDLEQMYEFIYKTAVCASRRERSKLAESDKYKGEPPIKRKKIDNTNRAFVAKVSRGCIICKNKQHPLYTCDRFRKLSVPERIEMIKDAKLCFNCLRSHRGIPCKFSNCTICQRRHNTLLHLDKQAIKPDASTSTTPQNK